MRPDEHKKKKNAVYKKKHEVSKSDKQKLNTQDAKGKPLQPPPKNSNTTWSKSAPDIGESNNNAPPFVESSSHYSKRRITSNWERYDEPEEEEQQIGVDYTELVAAAGGASSHLILQSEKDWQVEQNLDDLLSIDFQKVAELLKEIPFCERLGLDESELNPNLVKLLNGDQNDDADSYDSSNLVLRDYNFDFQLPAVKQTTSSLAGAKKSDNFPVENQHVIRETVGDQLPDDDVIAVKRDVTTYNVEAVHAKSSIESSGDLSQEHPVCSLDQSVSSLSENISSSPSAGNKKIELDTLEVELDSILDGTSISADTASNSINSTANTTDKSTTNAKNEEQEDLEDWLDSII